LFPAFARLHAAGERLAPAYLRAVRAISLLTLPGAATLALAAEPIVLTLFGRDWVGAVPILRALALYAAARSLGSSAGDVLKGTGAANALARLAVIKATLLLPALALTARHGATAVALAMAATTIAGTLLDLGVVSRRIGIGAADLLRSLGPALLVAAVAAAAVAAALALTREVAPAARLALAGLAAAPPLVAGLTRFEPGLWQALRAGRRDRPLGPEASST
jgi:O-antigen/teichoic acid export membrane protein